MTRSLVQLTKRDLRRLGQIAALDRASLFARKAETGSLYSSRLFAVALCQGGALHYLDRKNGIKDLDVWSFYTQNPVRVFPARRRGRVDFGDPKFGVTPDSPSFVGRRVDLIGRSILGANSRDPVGTLRGWLRDGSTESARLLAQKAMILIEPLDQLGTVVWPTR